MSHIIQARLEEIIEHIYYEIKNSGYENKLIAGMVITGGGSQMKHIGQLFEYVTGMDTRIGYPNEYLASGNSDEITSPMYATGVGLILKGFEKLERQKGQMNKNAAQEDLIRVRQGEKTKGGFLQNMLAKGKQFFEDDET